MQRVNETGSRSEGGTVPRNDRELVRHALAERVLEMVSRPSLGTVLAVVTLVQWAARRGLSKVLATELADALGSARRVALRLDAAALRAGKPDQAPLLQYLDRSAAAG